MIVVVDAVVVGVVVVVETGEESACAAGVEGQ